MILNFGVLHDGLRDVNHRFDENDSRSSQLKAQLGQLKSRMTNQRATHVNNPIEPVGLDDGTPIPPDLSRQYRHVHDFLRLKHRGKWQVLATLLHFYGASSWPTWGLVSVSFGDQSDTEEPLVSHDTLEAAIDWAPDIALQELARYIGLNYKEVERNVEEYERLRERRAMPKKRTRADKTKSSKRELLRVDMGQQPNARQAERDAKSTSSNAFSGVIGWDARATEERTPESQRQRFADAPPYRQRTASPTSVATSNSQTSQHTKQ